MAACADENGVIKDPRACTFDPASMRCPEGSDQPNCLTDEQVRVVRDEYRGPTDKDFPSITFSTVVPVKRILRPVAAGRPPTRKSSKAGPAVGSAAFPPADDIVALGDQIGGAPEVEVGERGAEVGHERLDVVAATARGMQRIFQQHVRGGDLIDDQRFTFLPQNSVNQRPTIALLSSCLLMEIDPLALPLEHHRSRSMIPVEDYALRGSATLRFLPWNSSRMRKSLAYAPSLTAMP